MCTVLLGRSALRDSEDRFLLQQKLKDDIEHLKSQR